VYFEKEKAMEYILLIVGFVLLIKGADLFVDGASSVAAKLKVPSLIIGLTVVSIGTSLPEAAVSVSASLSGNNSISLGNVIGSNIFNLLMVVGVSSAILPIVTDRDMLKRDMPINIGVTVLLGILLFDGNLSRLEALLLLLLLAAYMFLLIRSALKNRVEAEETKVLSWAKSIVFIVLGVAAIIGGGQLVVNSAKTIALALGMSETLVGLTVVAIGTSLPELVTSVVAARKGDSGIAMGNVIGSNLFNILFILGMAGVIKPMTADAAFFIDTGILLGISALMLLFAFTKRKISRVEGITCVLIYVAYTAYIIMRAYHIWIF
jgi:cation:H+ antiporter